MREEVAAWQELRRRLSDALELAQLEDQSLRADLEGEVEAVEAEVARREFDAML